MKKSIHWFGGLLLAVLLIAMAGCGFSSKPILGGTEQPDKIIEQINKNFDKDAQFQAMTSENAYPVWRSQKDAELRFDANSEGLTGVMLDILYNKASYDDQGADLLKRLLKTVADGDADKTIQALDLGGGTTKVADYGDYKVVKVDVEKLAVDPRDQERGTYHIPVMAVYIYHKNDDPNRGIIGSQTLEERFEDATRSNDELKDAYHYWDTFFNPDNPNQKPSSLDAVKFLN